MSRDIRLARIALLHGESRGDLDAFEPVLTFAPGGTATRIEMRTVFPARETALGQAREAAGDRDVPIAGGGATILEYVTAGVAMAFKLIRISTDPVAGRQRTPPRRAGPCRRGIEERQAHRTTGRIRGW